MVKKNIHFTALLALLLTLSAEADSSANAYTHHLNQCQSIPWSDYQTGMIFNPSDRQTVFRRSQCLQKMAIMFRDEVLCDRVKERKSWFFEGSGVSPQRCREQVKDKVSSDVDAAKQLGNFHKLKQVSFSLNGNGRDFDVQVETRGEAYHRYRLKIEIYSASGATLGYIYDEIQMLGKGDSRVVLLLRRGQMSGRVQLNAPYRAVVTLEPEMNEQSRFILQHIDEKNRRSSFTLPVTFSSLARSMN